MEEVNLESFQNSGLLYFKLFLILSHLQLSAKPSMHQFWHFKIRFRDLDFREVDLSLLPF